VRPYLKNNLKQKGVAQVIEPCLASFRPQIQTPVSPPHPNKKKEKLQSVHQRLKLASSPTPSYKRILESSLPTPRKLNKAKRTTSRESFHPTSGTEIPKAEYCLPHSLNTSDL
jgi:hypothetical protein